MSTLTCGRCGITDREPHVRRSLANREREAHQDGRPFVPPAYAHEDRCVDKVACRARVAAQPGSSEGRPQW